MHPDISKLCADFLRSEYVAVTSGGSKLKVSHARELVAAYFGYKSHAALLAEAKYPLHLLEAAQVLIPDIRLIEERRGSLTGLPADIAASADIASSISDYLQAQGLFGGKVWLHESLGEYVLEELLPDEDAHICDELSGAMAETNAYFDEAIYESAEIFDGSDGLRIEVEGQYNGSSDLDRPFCGDQIDMAVTVELTRVAGKVAYTEPTISANGSVNWDWAMPDDDDNPPKTPSQPHAA
jgi:hypothetical protein